MVTTATESMQLIGILLRYISKSKVVLMIRDMELEVGDITENVSLRESIKMAREYLE